MRGPKKIPSIKDLELSDPTLKRILKRVDLELKGSYYEGRFSDEFISIINHDVSHYAIYDSNSVSPEIVNAIYRISFELIRGNYHLVLKAFLNLKSYKAIFTFTFVLDCKSRFPANNENVNKYLSYSAMSIIRGRLEQFCNKLVSEK